MLFKEILAEPSKDTPAIVLALANVVAVEAAIPKASISDFVWSAVAPSSTFIRVRILAAVNSSIFPVPLVVLPKTLDEGIFHIF